MTPTIFNAVIDLPIGRFELKEKNAQLICCQKTSKKLSKPQTRVLKQAEKELLEYFKGTRQGFSIPLSFEEATLFQRKVWQKLQKVPYGKTVSYGELAVLAGSKGASRAVGSANAKNPLCLFIPCHRVIRANGEIGEYSAGGAKVKSDLLSLESRVLKN